MFPARTMVLLVLPLVVADDAMREICTVRPVEVAPSSGLAICAASQLGQRTAMPTYCAGMRAR